MIDIYQPKKKEGCESMGLASLEKVKTRQNKPGEDSYLRARTNCASSLAR